MSSKSFSIRLTTEERQILELIAADLGCISEYGNTKGKPSIAVLFKCVASGQLAISELGSVPIQRPDPAPKALKSGGSPELL